MRRFSSEGCLLDIDFFPWKKVALKKSGVDQHRHSGTYTINSENEDVPTGSAGLIPYIQKPSECAGHKKELTKEHSVSLEDICDAGVRNNNLLRVCELNEGCRAYSDGQLAPPIQNRHESLEKNDTPSPSTSSSFNLFTSSLNHEHPHKHKLSAAKLHLKSLFGQRNTILKANVQQNVSLHSSHSNLYTAQKDSAKERRSRLHFMHQWSQVGHSKRSKFSRKELENWAESLNTLLASQTGVSVFGAFLRSEFSEENLQFYLACEQYKHSSNNFSLQRRAKDICATYIQAGAPREVNLDSKTRDLTIQLLQAPSHTSLSHAQKRIYSLLDTDCYPRFLQSNVYLSLLQNAD